MKINLSIDRTIDIDIDELIDLCGIKDGMSYKLIKFLIFDNLEYLYDNETTLYLVDVLSEAVCDSLNHYVMEGRSEWTQ